MRSRGGRARNTWKILTSSVVGSLHLCTTGLAAKVEMQSRASLSWQAHSDSAAAAATTSRTSNRDSVERQGREQDLDQDEDETVKRAEESNKHCTWRRQDEP
jgi:hypothetical protein